MQTTASKLLELVFEGHHIRSTFGHEGKPLFVAKDVFTAAEIKASRDAYRRLKDYERVSSVVDTLGGKQTMVCLTESGVYHVLFSSQKPAAERLRCWLADEVLPQLLKYGTYAPGATAGERCHALHTRWKQERAQELGLHSAAYEESGLLTIAAFRKQEPCPGEDALLLSHHLRALAREQALDPARFFTGPRRHTPAWPRELLHAARRRANPTHFLSL